MTDLPDATETVQPSPELQELADSNAVKLRELMAMGARPDPSSVLFARLEVALSVIFEDAPELAERFALRYEQTMAMNLDHMLANVRKQRLMTPPNPGSKLIVPGRG